VLGTAIGLIAGYACGTTAAVLDLATTAVLVIPNMPLLLLLASFAGPVGPMTLMPLLALTSWPWCARTTRSQTMALCHR
ncbi:ABC transporter permease, partial [Rhizobium ruizarguesonis]